MATTRRTIKVDGIEGLEKNLNNIQDKISAVLAPAAKAGADIIRDEARRRAPIMTGNLRRGIISQITWDKGKSAAFAGAGMDKSMNETFVKFGQPQKRAKLSEAKTLKQLVKAPTPKRYYYPSAQEYGTKNMPANSFMRPAFDSKKNAARNEIKKIVTAAIKGVR